jgi:succinate---hydroxymethylglutarate CoA-transferase
MNKGPLSGVRVLSVEQYAAGPFGTMFLADQGAEVIKIENPNDGGDMGRHVGPFFLGDGDSLLFHSFNRNKKSLTLDLSREEGKAVFHDLVKGADAVATNLRGDVTGKLGLTFDFLKHHNPKIVCAHLTAYGRTGPRKNWPGFDYLMQAETGYLAMTGEPDGPPARCGFPVVDLMTGLAMAYSLLAALTGARVSGIGRDIDVSLFDVALSNTSYPATWYLNEGFAQDRLPRSAHPSLTPCQLFRSSDGWIFVMCNKEKFWPVLCDALGKVEWKDDPRFQTFADRLANRDEVIGLIDREMGTRTTAQWLTIFAGKMPAAPVYDIAEAMENPFLEDTGRIQTLTHPVAGDFRVVAPAVRRSDDTSTPAPAPSLGADTDDILHDLGYDEEQTAALRTAKVI